MVTGTYSKALLYIQKGEITGNKKLVVSSFPKTSVTLREIKYLSQISTGCFLLQRAQY